MLRAIVRNIAKKGGRELQTVRPFSIIVLWTKMRCGKGFYLRGGVPHRQDFISVELMPQRAPMRNFKKFPKKIAEKQGVFLFFA